MWIRNPVEWGVIQLAAAGHTARALGHALIHDEVDKTLAPPSVRRISFADLGDALVSGFADFAAFRDDVLFIAVIYPFIGLVVALAASEFGAPALVVPIVAGFALIGPFAALWLYEMSLRRERGETISWVEGFKAFASPAAASIFKLGLLLIGIFALWLAAAATIYMFTMGAEAPTSLTAFVHEALTTAAGWKLIGVGLGVGFLFAFVVLSISVVSFPLLLDRHVAISTAIGTSLRAMRANPGPMLAWGFIVAALLILGMIPLLTGLVVVLPVLGHATWHLYRKVVI